MEVAAHLAEAQEQLRALRRRGEPAAARGLMPSVAAAAGLLPPSLHREMHSSIYSELSLDSGIGDPLAQSVSHFLLLTSERRPGHWYNPINIYLAWLSKSVRKHRKNIFMN